MQLFAHGKNHALDGNRELHTVLHAQVQKTVPNLTKFLKKIRVSESRISERIVGAALRGRPSIHSRRGRPRRAAPTVRYLMTSNTKVSSLPRKIVER